MFAEMVGFDSPDPLIGRSLREGRGLEVPEILALAEGMLRGEEGVAEGSFRSIGGKWVELRIHVAPIRDESGAVIGGQAVCEDISARLETERALNESQARFNAIIDGDIDLVTELRSDGSQAYVSPNAARLFGIDWDRAGSGDHLHPDDLEALTEVIARVRNSRRPERFEYRIREQSGDWRWLESSIAPFAAHDEVRTIVVTRDVTQRRQLEEDLRQAQKMEAVGNLAAGVAHDFNNLLTAIGGNAELLIGSEALTEADRESAGEILAAAGRATALTRQLLTFSRKQPIDSRSVPLDATIAELEVMLRRLLGAHIELRFALGAGEACIQCDPIHLEQLVVNLALNARDAMPEGGRLRIETEAYPDAAAGAFGFARLIVSDTGVGMSAETRARIFEPFFTTKSVGEGTGLGLSTAYAIVEQVGGEIGVESEPSRGSRFTVKLPCSEPEFPVASDSTLPERCSGAGPATILLAEDEEAVRAVARAALESAGHQVIEAADGEEALAIAREHGGIDAVVTDVVMPRRGGLSVAEELSITHPGLPVLLISGYQPDPEATLAKPLLGKPFTRAQLTRSVSDMLVKRSGSAA